MPFTDMIAMYSAFLCFNKTEQKLQDTLPQLFPALFFLWAMDWPPHGAGHSRLRLNTNSRQKKRVSKCLLRASNQEDTGNRININPIPKTPVAELKGNASSQVDAYYLQPRSELSRRHFYTASVPLELPFLVMLFKTTGFGAGAGGVINVGLLSPLPREDKTPVSPEKYSFDHLRTG